jgi:hypothetical protein
MIAQCEKRADYLRRAIAERRQGLRHAERQLLEDAARTVEEAAR